MKIFVRLIILSVEDSESPDKNENKHCLHRKSAIFYVFQICQGCDPVKSKCFRVEVLSSQKLLGGLEYLSYIAISVNRGFFVLG